MSAHSQTFEAQRGISSVDVSHGHALVVVTGMEENIAAEKRLEALEILRASELSVDFLKLSLDGFSFLVPEADAEKVEQALRDGGFNASAMQNRAIVTVSAPNIRDESGLVARIAEIVVRSGAAIDSVGDMHSSVLVVVDDSVADQAAAALNECIGKVDLV